MAFYLQSQANWAVAAGEAEEQTRLPAGPWLQSLK